MASENEIAPLGADAEKSSPSFQSTAQPFDSQNYEDGIHDDKRVHDNGPASGRLGFYIRKFEQRLVAFNLEARGLERVHESERMKKLTWISYLQAALLWVSMNLAANNMTLGMLGPITYGLGFRDASLCAVFGAFVGALIAAWIATWGPVSGIRTMAFGRYAMGWWPSKIIVILNLIQMIGYSLIDCVVGGQILSAVSPHGSMSVAVGIVVIAIISWVVATFGIRIFHYYERFAFLPQLIVVCILFGVSASKFDLSTPSSGNPRTLAGNRLSFFSLCLSSAITYAPLAADFFVYYPETTSRASIFTLTLTGLMFSFTMAYMIGIGLASATFTNPSYNTTYNNDGAGALIVHGFHPLTTFGNFCAVIVALGLIGNTIAPTYCAGVDFQVLGRYAEKVPRPIWTTVAVIIYTVCALVGRSNLSEIFTNFLALMGYWVIIWFGILLEERYIFRKRSGFNWAVWNDPSKLPVGVAGFLAFGVGWVGAILCMAQVWYIGPLAKLVGDYGADMGNYVGFSWAALVYPPLRYIELRIFGR